MDKRPGSILQRYIKTVIIHNYFIIYTFLYKMEFTQWMYKNKVILMIFLGSFFLINTQIDFEGKEFSIKNEDILINKPILTSTTSFSTTSGDTYENQVFNIVLNSNLAIQDNNSSTLFLKITNKDKTPITSAHIISISTPYDQQPFEIITNSTGLASISNLPPGTYQFKIEKEGYKTIERSAVIGVGNTYTYIYELETSSAIPFFDVSILTISLLIVGLLLRMQTRKENPSGNVS